MHRVVYLLILVSAATSAAEPRFTGAAGLSVGPKTGGGSSPDGRFDLQADLHPATPVQGTGRFGLTAKLLPDPKSITTTCGPLVDQIFRNGFE